MKSLLDTITPSMMRLTNTMAPLLITISLVSCGSGGGGAGAPAATSAVGTETKPSSQASTFSIAVDSEADLPTCAEANAKQLVYVKSSSTFKSCDSGVWTAIDINGKDGAAGLSITSNQLLDSFATNICTQFSAIESCYFNGGQIVKYSDGSVLITGTYVYQLYVTSGTNGGYAEYDRMASSITMIVPPATTAAYQRLDWSVSRGTTSLKSLYMVYVRSTDTLKIVFDSNGNNVPEASDELVHTVVTLDW